MAFNFENDMNATTRRYMYVRKYISIKIIPKTKKSQRKFPIITQTKKETSSSNLFITQIVIISKQMRQELLNLYNFHFKFKYLNTTIEQF